MTDPAFSSLLRQTPRALRSEYGDAALRGRRRRPFRRILTGPYRSRFRVLFPRRSDDFIITSRLFQSFPGCRKTKSTMRRPSFASCFFIFARANENRSPGSRLSSKRFYQIKFDLNCSPLSIRISSPVMERLTAVIKYASSAISSGSAHLLSSVSALTFS